MNNVPLAIRYLSEVRELISEDEYQRLEALVKEKGFTTEYTTYEAACGLSDKTEEQTMPK